MIAYILLKAGDEVGLLIYAPLFLLLFIWIIIDKVCQKRQQIKRAENLKKILQRAKNENWIRINIKDTQYTIQGFTHTTHDDGYPLSDRSTAGALDRQFFIHRSKTNYSHYHRIHAEFEINHVAVTSVSQTFRHNPISLNMFCESGLFDILINPNNYEESIWMEL